MIKYLIFLLLFSCSPSIKGIIIYPDGKPVTDRKVTVYSNPWTESVKTTNGKFNINKNIVIMKDYDYTIWVEDSIGNLGKVSKLLPQKKNKITVIFLRELTAKEAAIDYDGIHVPIGAGEKIFRQSE